MRILKGGAAALAVFAVGVSPAAAQTSNQLLSAPPSMLQQVGAGDVAAMMGELDVGTQLVATEGAAPILIAETPGGARFAFRFFGCDAPAEAEGCRNVIVTTAMSSAGATYDDLNRFNGEAVVTTAVNVPGEQMIIFGRNIIVLGGHSRDLFKGTVYLFLADVGKFQNDQSGVAAVSFSRGPEATTKITSLALAEDPAPGGVFGLEDLSPDVTSAIANVRGVDFLLEYDSGL